MKNDPPTIFISFKPAMILLVNGKPVLAPVGGNIKDRGQCQLAVVRGVGDVLPVQQQGLDDIEDSGRELGCHYESCRQISLRSRRVRTIPT